MLRDHLCKVLGVLGLQKGVTKVPDKGDRTTSHSRERSEAIMKARF